MSEGDAADRPPPSRIPAAWLLLHEVLFGLLFVTVLVSLAVAGTPDPASMFFFGSFLLLQCLLVLFFFQRPTPTRWRLRLLLYPLLINVVYLRIPQVVAALGLDLQDSTLLQIDRLLIGGDLSVRLEPFVSPHRTELLSGAYLFYIFVPAQGPYLAFPHLYAVPLVGGALYRFMAAVVRLGGIRVDVFPSLHCAVPAFILAFDFIHKRRRFWICLAPCLLLLFSTLYLRYHYFIDLLGGLFLAAIALALAERWRLGGRLAKSDLAT